MNKNQSSAHRLLVQRWEAAMVGFDAIGIDVHPASAYDVFSLTANHPKPAGVIGFDIKPTIFNLPERAQDVSSDLYIFAKGWIDLDEAEVVEHRLRTVGFGTEAAYFRARQNSLKHVFGVHYDFSVDQKGHPVFHGQVQNYVERGHDVVALYPFALSEDNPFKEILKTVRMPVAQMDFFALLSQIFADHLIDKDSDTTRLGYFDAVRNASQNIKGVPELLPRIAEAQCMRGTHWYV